MGTENMVGSLNGVAGGHRSSPPGASISRRKLGETSNENTGITNDVNRLESDSRNSDEMETIK